MSRAFVKDDAANEQVLVPPRAHLPPGTTNFVTPRGLALLNTELERLQGEQKTLEAGREDATVRAPRLASLAEQIEALEDRIRSAKLIRPEDVPQGEVAFGATVTVNVAGQERRFSVVGVDEASAQEGRVAFTAPIAQALMGHKVGDEVRLQTARDKQALKIEAIEYPPSSTS